MALEVDSRLQSERKLVINRFNGVSRWRWHCRGYRLNRSDKWKTVGVHKFAPAEWEGGSLSRGWETVDDPVTVNGGSGWSEWSGCNVNGGWRRSAWKFISMFTVDGGVGRSARVENSYYDYRAEEGASGRALLSFPCFSARRFSFSSLFLIILFRASSRPSPRSSLHPPYTRVVPLPSLLFCFSPFPDAQFRFLSADRSRDRKEFPVGKNLKELGSVREIWRIIRCA